MAILSVSMTVIVALLPAAAGRGSARYNDTHGDRATYGLAPWEDLSV